MSQIKHEKKTKKRTNKSHHFVLLSGYAFFYVFVFALQANKLNRLHSLNKSSKVVKVFAGVFESIINFNDCLSVSVGQLIENGGWKN